MTVTWPDVLKPSSWSHELRSFALSGGRSIAGTEQRVISGAGRWEIRYDIPVHSRQQILAWRAMLDRMRTGENALVKVYDMQPVDGARRSAEISAVVAVSAALGATTIQIDATGIDIEPGIHFSIGQRLYRVNRVAVETTSTSLSDILVSEDKTLTDTATWLGTVTGGSRYTLNILPPLRAAASAGAAAEFVNPVCLCVPVDLNDGDLSLDLGRFATPSITFREA